MTVPPEVPAYDVGSVPAVPAYDVGSAPEVPAHDHGSAPEVPAYDVGSVPAVPAYDVGSAPEVPAHDVSSAPAVPAYDVVLDERGRLCPLPVIALARATAADPAARVLLLADDAAAETDVPAWCGLRGRVLAWTGNAPDGRGRAYLVTPS